MESERWKISRGCLKKFLGTLDSFQLWEAGLIWKEVVVQRETLEEKMESEAFADELRRQML